MSFTCAGFVVIVPSRMPFAATLVLAVGAIQVQAQSLAEVVDAACNYDAAYLGARANADAVRYRYEQALALHRPVVNAMVQGQHYDSYTPYAAAYDSATSTKSNSGNAGITASQTIFNRQNDLSIDQAQKQIDFAQSQVQQAEQDLIIRVTQAYFNVLSATEALQTMRANGKAIAEQLASVKRNLELGNATITDMREAEARFDLASSQEIGAANELQVSHVTLDQLIGRNGVVAHPLALPATLPPVTPSLASDWIALTEAENPVLRQAQLTRDVAELETGRAKAGHLPTLAATAGYTKNYERNRYVYSRCTAAGAGVRIKTSP